MITLTIFTTDIIKFFQAFVRQMVKIGGKNLPKTISSSLGSELGKSYLKKNVLDWKKALTGMITAMGGKLEIVEKEGSWLLISHYPTEFCPIGGKPDSVRFADTTDSICIPYLTGYLQGLRQKLTQNPLLTKCIVRDGGKTCEFQIELAK